MRISDWSSDVCSSDLCLAGRYVRLHTVNCGLSLTVILDLIGDSPLRIRTASLRAERSNLLLSSCIVDGWRLLRRTAPRNDEGGLRMSRSEEHTSELQSLMRISYAVFCLKKKTTHIITIQ